MTLRPLALAIASLPLVIATAHAQAPGEVAPESAAPPAPVASNPCSRGAAIDPMAHRWAIALGIGAFSVAPEGAPEGSEAEFKTTEIALRYRATRRFEIELALSGGRQVIDDDIEGDLAHGTFMLGARYRFMPERKWNWWVSGGLGGTVIAHHTSDEDAREAAQRPAASLGIGIERRFRRLAIQAELKSFAIGPRADQTDDAPNVMPPRPEPTDPNGGTMEPPKEPYPVPPSYSGEPEELRGASFSINLSYYF